MSTFFGYNYSNDNFFFSDGATDNQAWTTVTLSDTGRIIDLNAYFAGDTAGCTGGPALWSQAGTTLIQYTSHSVAQGSHSSSGGTTVTTSGLDITFAGSISYQLGAFRNSADSWVVPFPDNQGAFGVLKTVSGTSPGDATGGSSWLSQTGFVGGINAYGHFFSVQLYVKRSGVWTKVFCNVRRSGAWSATKPKVYVRRSGVWTQVGIVAKDQELDWKKEISCIVEWTKGVWEKGLLKWFYDQPQEFGYKNRILIPQTEIG